MVGPRDGVIERSIALRASTEGDREFLYGVYASTRTEELELTPWDNAQKEAFLRQQFDAQDLHYRRYYPATTFDLIVLDGAPAGRLYVDRRDHEIRIVDISLLPEYRNSGVGSVLLGGLLDEARLTGRKVSIHVEIFNPAMTLYERLGFERTGERGVHVLMEWKPADDKESSDHERE
jgi:GNAT superfamily N-acetyltransferase